MRDRLVDVLAVADVYVALTSDRPWRHAFAPDEAMEILAAESDQRRLHPAAVRAVLESAGHVSTGIARTNPDGLTAREVEVLELLARGFAIKQVASKLGIAYKTADNHIQRVYRKIGANTRTAAAMYALENGIFTD